MALAPRESGELGAALAAGESARFGTRWAETEEVACSLVARSHLTSQPGCWFRALVGAEGMADM